jgi:hypothetical protein
MPSRPPEAPVARYLAPECALTLREALAEYRALNPGLLVPSHLPPAAAELFRQHDAGHVVFGCDTSLRGETLIDTWTVVGSTAGLRGYLKYFELPQVNQIFADTGYLRIALGSLRCLPDVIRVLWRSRRQRARWPWAEYERHLERPLAEIRSEFGIRVV